MGKGVLKGGIVSLLLSIPFFVLAFTIWIGGYKIIQLIGEDIGTVNLNSLVIGTVAGISVVVFMYPLKIIIKIMKEEYGYRKIGIIQGFKAEFKSQGIIDSHLLWLMATPIMIVMAGAVIMLMLGMVVWE